MRDWYENLEAREQVFVLVGAVFVVIALLFYGLWQPLDKRHTQVATSVENFEQALAAMQPLRELVANGNPNRPAGAPISQQAPIIVVSQTLQRRGLEQYNRRSAPTPNGVQVRFENVAFDELVLWLGELGNNYGLIVQQGTMQLAPQAGPGRINASLTLERAL
ncbi:MAG: type II secretion system protein M [Chromatiales bacterium]|nr:MAG: type II secretion system protein M [Chromatiales bacterium]